MEARPYDMYTHQESIHIDAPPERVFAIVGNLDTSPAWAGSGQVKSMTKTTPGPVGIGTQYIADEKILIPFQAVSEITGYEPNELIVWTSKPTMVKKSAPHRWMFRLVPEDGGTRLTQEVRAARAVGFERVMQATMVKLSGGMEPIGRGMKRTLENIKVRAEGPVTADSSVENARPT
jgi:uncharacterized protein YndB with AHSA1/START domain